MTFAVLDERLISCSKVGAILPPWRVSSVGWVIYFGVLVDRCPSKIPHVPLTY